MGDDCIDVSRQITEGHWKGRNSSGLDSVRQRARETARAPSANDIDRHVARHGDNLAMLLVVSGLRRVGCRAGNDVWN